MNTFSHSAITTLFTAGFKLEVIGNELIAYHLDSWSIFNLHGSVVVRSRSANINYPTWYYAPKLGASMDETLLNALETIISSNTPDAIPALSQAIEAIKPLLPLNNEAKTDKECFAETLLSSSPFSANIFDDDEAMNIYLDLTDAEDDELKIHDTPSLCHSFDLFAQTAISTLAKQPELSLFIGDRGFSDTPLWIQQYIKAVFMVARYEYACSVLSSNNAMSADYWVRLYIESSFHSPL